MKTILFKPFERYNSNLLIAVGSAALIVSVLLAYWFQVRYDGVLDAHFVRNPTLQEVALDVVLNTISLLFFLFIAGKIINVKTRIVDVLSAILISRIPMALIPFANAGQMLSTDADPNDLEALTEFAMNNLIPLVIGAIVIILLVVWSVALLYNGYKTACNGKGSKSVILFILALLLSEIGSKILIHHLNDSL